MPSLLGDHRAARRGQVDRGATCRRSARAERAGRGRCILRFLVRGAIEPWLPGSAAQNEVVTQAAATATGRFAAAGYETVYDGVVGPGSFDLRDLDGTRPTRLRRAAADSRAVPGAGTDSYGSWLQRRGSDEEDARGVRDHRHRPTTPARRSAGSRRGDSRLGAGRPRGIASYVCAS